MYQPQPGADPDSPAGRWWRVVMTTQAANFDDLDDARQGAADWDDMAARAEELNAQLDGYRQLFDVPPS
jgi:hypothetical protein